MLPIGSIIILPDKCQKDGKLIDLPHIACIICDYCVYGAPYDREGAILQIHRTESINMAIYRIDLDDMTKYYIIRPIDPELFMLWINIILPDNDLTLEEVENFRPHVDNEKWFKKWM